MESNKTLSVLDALRALEMIEGSLDAFVDSAPVAVEAMGGRDAIQKLSQMTCIGPVPRFSVDQWTHMAEEHRVNQREQKNLEGLRAKGLLSQPGNANVPGCGTSFTGVVSR